MKLCVFGAASDNVAQIYKDKVYEMGKVLAQNGYDMVFGAGGTGLMGKAATGFHDGGAEVFGVIPRFFKNISREPIFENCNKIIKTDTMRERKRIMDESADAFIIVPGGIGTLDETFEILTLKQLNQLDKPIIFYNINGFYDDLFGYINNHIIGEQFANRDINSLFVICETLEDLVSYVHNMVFLVNKKKFKLGISSMSAIEKDVLEDNVVIQDLSREERKYYIFASQIPFAEVEKRLNQYDKSSPKEDEVKMVKELAKQFNCTNEDILTRISQIRKVQAFRDINEV